MDMGAHLSIKQQLTLTRPVTKAEVKGALKTIADIKSPRPDGYGSWFFKTAWSIIKDDLCNAVLEFLTWESC